MSENELSKPYIHGKDWVVFPETTFTNINLNDCNDTIGGVCYTNKTFDECVAFCENDPDKMCSAGYYLRTKKGENICIPLRTDLYNDYQPYYMLKDKSYYPEMDDAESTVFINRKVSPYPPNLANVMFYKDHLQIQNTHNKTIMGISPKNKITFKIKSNQNIQIYPAVLGTTHMTKYLPIAHGDSIVVIIPGTSLVLRQDTDNNNIIWDQVALTIHNPENSFKIFSMRDDKKVGNFMDYDEDFYLTYNGQIVSHDNETNVLTLLDKANKKDNANKATISFTTLPDAPVYYCKDKKCNMVSLKDTVTTGPTAKYENIPVTRQPGCWGNCNPKSVNKFPYRITAVVIVLIVFLLAAYILLKG